MSLTSKNNEKIGAVNRGTPCESGLCNFCRTDCQGRCETWLSSLLGRRTLVPRDYGNATIGTENTTHVGVSYNALRIRGRVFGGAGLDPEKARTGDAAYCDADLTTAVGSNAKYPCDYPFLIGALSRNPVVDKYWDSFAVGAALCGIPLVIGENVGGGDNKTEFNPDGSIRALPDLDRRIAVYRRYYNGKGALFVQLNANDAYNGVADYVARKYGDFVCVEIKWGQGAKPINGEGLIRDLDYARFMKSRSYCLRPDPEVPAVQEAFRAGRVKHFTRYTGLTYPALSTPEDVLAEVAAKAEQLRANGAARLALKTGAFGMPDLALAIRVASELDFELLTIDGSGGGTGMSPNDMLDNWGVPSVLLHAKAHDYAFLRAAAGKKVVDLAVGGGLAKPSIQGAGPRRPLRQGCMHVALVHDPGLPRLQHRRGPAPRTPGTRPRRVVGASEDGPRHRRYARNHLRRIPCPQGTPRSRRNGAYPLRSHRHVDNVRQARRRAPAPHGRGPQVRHRAHRPHGHLRRQPRNGSGNGHPLHHGTRRRAGAPHRARLTKEKRSCWICS